MAKVLIGDILAPDIWERAFIKRTAELAAFVQSGIISNDPAYAARAAGGGNTVNMPFFTDLSGARQILTGAGDLSVNGLSEIKDVACIQEDAQAWSVNVLAEFVSGEDPMAAIASLIGTYWARVDQLALIATLKGVFSVATMAGNLLSILAESTPAVTDSTRLNGVTFIDALQKLGDAKEGLTAIAMHSAVEAALRKQDMIDTIPDSQSGKPIALFQGRRVVVDDGLPTRAGTTSGTVYRTYVFGAGAIGQGFASLSTPLATGTGTQGVEYARAALSSDDILINRRRYILHPRGVKWLAGTCVGSSPTDLELATTNNWLRVFEAKQVKLVAIDHNI